MMTLSTEVQVVPDLALLACPPTPTLWDRQFIDEYWAAFLVHDQKINEYGFDWVLSDELVNYLLAQFPWTEIGKIEWVSLVMIDFEERWRRFKLLPSVSHPGAKALPNIIPHHVSHETANAWLNVLVTCVQAEPVLSYIASYPRQAVASLLISSDQDSSVHNINIIRKISEWDNVLAQIDLGFLEGLPQTGDMAYIPPKYWRLGQPFPKGQSSNGFLDAEGRTWEWDVQEKHWDVQDQRQGHGRYIRVTIKGTILD